MSSEETPPAWAAWVAQAEHDVQVAGELRGMGYFDACLVYSEQAAEKMTKALWMVRHGHAAPRTHAVGRLLAALEAPETVVSAGHRLTRRYFASRYPAMVSGPPCATTDAQEADAALADAEEVIAWVRTLLPAA